MPINPVSGEIKAQPLNDNFSYLDSKVDQVNGGPKETFTSVSALQSKYPSGSNSAMLVTDATGSNGYLYTWNGTSWVKGPLYQSQGIADNSISEKKVIEKGLTLTEISDQGVAFPTTYRFTNTNPDTGNVANTAIYSPIVTLNAGDKIQLKDNSSKQFSFFRTDGGSNVGWNNIDVDITTSMTGYIGLRKLGSGVISDSDRLNLVSNLFVTSPNTITNYERFVEKTAEVVVDHMPFDSNSKTYNNLRLNSIQTSTTIYQVANTEIPIGSSPVWNSPSTYAEGEHIYTVIYTDDETGTLGNLFYFRQRLGSTTKKTSYSSYVGNGVYFIDHIWITENVDGAQLLLDNRLGTKDIVIKAAGVTANKLWAGESAGTSGSQKVIYTDAVNGSNVNDGTETEPVKTLQKAIDLGATTIIMAQGEYVGSVISQTKKERLTIIGNGSTILGAEKIEFVDTDNEYKTALYTNVNNSRLDQVFIKKTLIPISNETKKGYNVSLFEMTDSHETTLKLVPVLSLEELSEPGTMFYDGETITIHPFDSTSETPKEYWLALDSAKFQIWNVSDLKISDLRVLHGYNSIFDIDNNPMIEIKNCEASYSANGDGFSVDNSNGNFYRCTAIRNSNDGFNFHYEGDTHLSDCYGLYNHDDGHSHHDNCTGSVHGGEWAFNRKGGAAPASGAKIDYYNIYSHHNGFGIYNYGGTGVESCLFFNNLLIDNTDYDIGISGYKDVGYNNHYVTSQFLDGKETNLVEY